jgi:hypothetical protein
MNREIDFTDLAREYVDCEFDPDNKVDCLGMILGIYRKLGYQFPTEFEGFTEKNFLQKWRQGEGRDVLRRFIASLGEPVGKNFEQAGDLFYGEIDKKYVFGIYLGQDNALVMFADTGGRVLPFTRCKPYIQGMRRLLSGD